jgi:hypothetical protein
MPPASISASFAADIADNLAFPANAKSKTPMISCIIWLRLVFLDVGASSLNDDGARPDAALNFIRIFMNFRVRL